MKFHEKHFPFHFSPTHTLFTPIFVPETTPVSPFLHDDIPSIFHNSSPTFPPPPLSSLISHLDTSLSPPATSLAHSPILSPPSSPTLDLSYDITTNNLSDDTSTFLSQPLSFSPRRSTRPSKLPTHLKDYTFSLPTKSVANLSSHWCNFVQFSSLSSTHHALISHVSSLVEPTSYADAIADPNWIQAMDKELAALAANKTWEVVPLPPSKKPIGCKWVCKVKLKSDGTLERYKARLVAKGYTQQYGVDFQEEVFMKWYS